MSQYTEQTSKQMSQVAISAKEYRKCHPIKLKNTKIVNFKDY